MRIGERKTPKKDGGHRRNPEPEPPAGGRSADNPEENENQQAADAPDEEAPLDLVPEPARPVLHRESIGQPKMMTVDGEGSIQQSDGPEQEQCNQ